jgi:hypothetical protein
MDTLRALFSSHYWLNISVKKMLLALLGTFGALWLIVEIASFFSAQAGKSIHDHWTWFFVAGIAIALASNWPRHRISCQLKNRDVRIEIVIGDMFKLDGAFVIGATTTFDTDTSNSLISPRSVQGKFTRMFYSADAHLQADLSKALESTPSTGTVTRSGQIIHEYPVGTVAPVTVRGQKAYFIGITSLNQHGVAQATFEDLKTSLPHLWEFLTTRGDLQRVVMPVLGSGFARLPETREEIIREIVKSFVAACSSIRPTEALTIVIPADDFYKNRVDLEELERYVQHTCKYTDFVALASQNIGTPLVIKRDSQAPKAEPVPDSEAKIFADKGDRVRHQKYGDGTVLVRDISNGDVVLTVMFTRYGLKKLSEKFANLERL